MIYAGFWKRKTAYAIDVLIVLVLYMLWAWLLGSIAHAQTAEDVKALIDSGWLPAGTDQNALLQAMQAQGIEGGASGSALLFDLFVSLAVSAFYNIAFVAGAWQATPGKRYCKLQVVTVEGKRLTLLQSAMRHLMSGVSMLPLGLGYITMFFSYEKAALHDFICGTRVVYREAV